MLCIYVTTTTLSPLLLDQSIQNVLNRPVSCMIIDNRQISRAQMKTTAGVRKGGRGTDGLTVSARKIKIPPSPVPTSD